MNNMLLPIALALTMLSFAPGDDVAELRAGGQAAVDALHERVLSGEAGEAQLDRVCAQKDCVASRLYWYTDFEEAKAAARTLRRPILALHLLGRLDEELSCANSRFFRTLLYSDETISAVLREHYVLYWYSVRPVPRITIELGEGRVIRQTITGNSAHYLLSEEGEVLDALPGLYSPKAFLEQITDWVALHESRAELARYHQERAAFASVEGAVNINAEEASRFAATKAAPEVPMLRQLQPGAMRRVEAPRLAASADVEFSETSLALMRRKQPISAELLDTLRRSVAADTELNENVFHARIHQWFADGEVTDLASLNERVYRELFLTPLDDEWMGLKPASVFTAIAE